ncbi:hypothetical protein TWF718_000500 [Orbilia javanica]|uniref:Uncharacterized protein n=1 Tax=Orbilia javanica TaxID=47235 RepID=A0AAN8N4E8_9PEZI
MHDESLLLYARAYDLVEDYTSISPLSYICLPYDSEEEIANDPDLISEFLQSLTFRNDTRLATKNENERLEVVKDVTSLLAKTVSLRAYTEGFENFNERQVSNKSLYLDEPLLRYRWGLGANTAFSPIDLNLFPLKEVATSDEGDEGLGFPSWVRDRRNEISKEPIGEKMVIDRKVLEYLRKMVKDTDCEERLIGEDKDDGYYHDLEALDPKEITPPLSPLLLPGSPLLSTPLNELAERLEPLTLGTREQLSNIHIFERSHGNEALDEDIEAIDLFKSIQLPPLISSSPIRSPAKGLRIEAPLTPPFTSPNKKISNTSSRHNNTSSPPNQPAKRVKLSEAVEEFIIPPSLDPSEDGIEDGANPDDYLTQSAMAEFTLGVMEPGAQFFLMQLQQEQLEDSTKSEEMYTGGLRVELPVVNWKRPVPPWILDKVSNEEPIGAMDKEIMTKWEYRKSLDIAGLHWGIGITSTFQPGITETIFPETEEELWEGIEEVFPVLPLETVIEDEDESFWKDLPQDDEHLECAKIQPKTDLDSLVERKRIQRPATRSKYPSVSLLDPRSNLSSFLSLQNRIIEPPLDGFVRSSSTVPPPAPSPVSCSQTNPSTVQPSISTSPMPSDPSSTFIISASFLANRVLYKIIRSFCPTSIFVERDFEPFTSIKIFGKEDQVPEEYTIEADIIVSPLVGIILTDLQTIRRRPLPSNFLIADNASPSPPPIRCEEIRDRISELSRRYQRLIVGVSVDFGRGNGEMVELGTTDCTILAAFTGFCEAIGNVEAATIVPGNGRSGVQEIARWVVETMNIHSTQWRNVGLEVEITEKESMWETFLRNSGMNSYAAQAVLTKLHESGCGLVDFVTIEKESRRVIFEQFVGGKSLERFEEVSGAQWQHG